MTDPTPDEVRTAILKSFDSLNPVRGSLPSNVEFRLMMADSNLRAAMHAVDLWEASLKQKEQGQA